MEQHTLSVRRHQKGKTAMRPTQPLYGCTGRCSCGWTGRSNHAPSQGGTAALRADHLEATGARATVYR